MSNRTKLELEDAFKELLLKKPFHKITITDLTDACHISRMAFYYHFQDLYDLVEWVLIEDATKALNEKKDYQHWKEGLLNIFEAVYENKPFILNVYHDISREQIENLLFRLVHDLLTPVIEERSQGVLTDKQKDFVAHFYKYAFVGMMLDWIQAGMVEDYHEVVDNIEKTVQGTIDLSIKNFTMCKE